MGTITQALARKISPNQQNRKTQDKKHKQSSIYNVKEASRSNFNFLKKLNTHKIKNNIQSIMWVASNRIDQSQKIYIKQINKYELLNNHRVQSAHIQLQLLKSTTQHYGGEFVNKLLFAFQDYQYLYLVQQYNPGFTLDKVLKNHFFTQQQSKYVIAALIQLTQYMNFKGYTLAQLSPQHILISKSQGKLKLLQIVNPIEIDECYPYEMIIEPCIYSAPQVLARDQILAQSDYYTIGVIMYQMMTQKGCFPIDQKQSNSNSNQKQQILRNNLLSHQVDIKKYNLPEGWNPEAADFLLKLLIKNPEYRLGRYGSFELKSHPWLRNYNWDSLSNKNGVFLLHQDYFGKQTASSSSLKQALQTKQAKLQQQKITSETNTQSQIKTKLTKINRPHQLVHPMQKTQKFIKIFEKYKFISQQILGGEGKELNKTSTFNDNYGLSIQDKYKDQSHVQKSLYQKQKQVSINSDKGEIQSNHQLVFSEAKNVKRQKQKQSMVQVDVISQYQ